MICRSGIVLFVLIASGFIAMGASAGVDIVIDRYPQQVRAGDTYEVAWSVLGTGKISHTNVHWGYTSGLNASDYPNSGRVLTGSAPSSFNDSIIQAPLYPTTIYLRVHLVMDREYVSNEFTISILPLSNATKPETTIVYYPETGVQPGAGYNVTWQVVGGKVISHTNVHWGTMSNNYPNEGQSFNSTSPQIFTNMLIAPLSNVKVYFIVHFKVDSIDYYTKEYSFQVGKSPIPEIVSVQYPSRTMANGKYNISWRLEGGTPGSISLTRVIWGKESGKLTEAGRSFSGSTPKNFTDTLTAPGDTLRVYFQVQYVVDSMQYLTSEYAINITGGVQVAFRFTVTPPPDIPVGREFTVSWEINGGNRVEMTRFEWGREKGLHPDHGNEFSGKSGYKFVDIIKAPDQASRLYYVVYYKIDGVEFTSDEGNFFVYQPGAGLDATTGGIILALVLITVILAYLLIRNQRTTRLKQKGEIGITDAKRRALEYLASFYGVKESVFAFHDAYPVGGDGFEIVYTSPRGLIRYKIYVDHDGHVVRFTGSRRKG